MATARGKAASARGGERHKQLSVIDVYGYIVESQCAAWPHQWGRELEPQLMEETVEAKQLTSQECFIVEQFADSHL